MPQENNMAEVLRLLRTLIVKTDGLATDMKKVETRFDRVDAKVDFLAGRFEDVARVFIEDTKRITSLEGRVDILESKAN